MEWRGNKRRQAFRYESLASWLRKRILVGLALRFQEVSIIDAGLGRNSPIDVTELMLARASFQRNGDIKCSACRHSTTDPRHDNYGYVVE